MSLILRSAPRVLRAIEAIQDVNRIEQSSEWVLEVTGWDQLLGDS